MVFLRVETGCLVGNGPDMLGEQARGAHKNDFDDLLSLSAPAPASANFPVSEQVLTKWQGTFYSKEKRQISLLPYSDVHSFVYVVRESQLLSFSGLSSKFK